MTRSALFAYYHEHAGREATRSKVPTKEAIAATTPIVVMIECAVAAADGDLDNPFTPKEGLQASILQGLYTIFLAVPLHLFAIFCSRDANRTDAFSSAWSAVAVILLLHYAFHFVFILLHICGAYRLAGPYSRCVIGLYRLVVTLTMFAGMFIVTMMLFWLGSTVSYHQGYVIKGEPPLSHRTARRRRRTISACRPRSPLCCSVLNAFWSPSSPGASIAQP